MQATLWAEWDLLRLDTLPGAELPPLTEADIGHFESAPVDWV